MATKVAGDINVYDYRVRKFDQKSQVLNATFPHFPQVCNKCH